MYAWYCTDISCKVCTSLMKGHCKSSIISGWKILVPESNTIIMAAVAVVVKIYRLQREDVEAFFFHLGILTYLALMKLPIPVSVN